MIEYTIGNFTNDVAYLTRVLREGEMPKSVYGVKRGGVVLAMALSHSLNVPMVGTPIPGDTLIVDDVIDSGQTRKIYNSFPFASLHIKKGAKVSSEADTYTVNPSPVDDWISYWWENRSEKVEHNITRMIQAIGDDPNREGLLETPKRVVKMYESVFSGYGKKVSDVIKQFDGEGYNQIVLLKDIEFYSMCEHHMLPFIGKAHIAYIPNKKVIGISKLARLLEIFSRRLQVQERLTKQVADALTEYLKPQASACIIEASHFCMRMRGVGKQNSTMVTSSLQGSFMDDSKCREELMFLIRKG